MPFTSDLVQELNALIRFDLTPASRASKVQERRRRGFIGAVQRLHAKGLITQTDGGYLTSLWRDAAEHAQTTLGLLTEGVAAAVGK